MKKLLSITLLLILSFYLFLIGDGFLNDQVLESDTQRYGVVYGNKVELDGTPSHRLKARLDAGYDLYETGIVSKLIVSGGVGIEGFDEAKIMGEYLEEKGVVREDIIVDSDGYTSRKTSENIRDFIDIETQVIGITQWYHVSRVKLSLKQAGFTNVYGFAPKYFERRDMYSIIREGPAYIKYLLKL